MERRLLLAVGLMIALMVLTNVLFPPAQLPPTTEADSAVIGVDSTEVLDIGQPVEVEQTVPAAIDSAIADAPAQGAPEETPEETPAGAVQAPEAAASDTVVVRSRLYEYRFDSRGAAMVSAGMLDYLSYGPGDDEGQLVDLISEGDAIFGYRLAVGRDTVDLRGMQFEASSLTLDVDAGEDELVFRGQVGSSVLTLEVTYRFRADSYVVSAEGHFEGLGDVGHTVLTSLGRGLRSNEANPREDAGQKAIVSRDRRGRISSMRLGSIDPTEERALEGGPFGWVASKSKYFLAALVSEEDGPGFGGLLLRGTPESNTAHMEAALPVPSGVPGFRLVAFVGPQDFSLLNEVGQNLQNVNPFGWRWLQWAIRPLAGVIVAVMVWMHGAFHLAYGWVLMLFGVLTRILFFPLYQKSMRAQMKQMHVQPLLKEIQEKYKDEPQKLQQEMMKMYREHGVNPAAGCLPMLAPFPILITLFFVFQNTIEFRGVPFLWLPDLSLKDPLYIVPLFMGGSMLLLNWIGQRGMEGNTQTKVMTYVLPVVFTFLFANFAAGLNLYYATSNVASLPQQLYLARERRIMRERAPAKAGGEEKGSAKKSGAPKRQPRGRPKGPGRGRSKR
jgi:YidC/Oxa1 family membrane protein insertase